MYSNNRQSCIFAGRPSPGRHIFCLQILQFHILTPLCHLISENIVYPWFWTIANFAKQNTVLLSVCKNFPWKDLQQLFGKKKLTVCSLQNFQYVTHSNNFAKFRKKWSTKTFSNKDLSLNFFCIPKCTCRWIAFLWYLTHFYDLGTGLLISQAIRKFVVIYISMISPD